MVPGRIMVANPLISVFLSRFVTRSPLAWFRYGHHSASSEFGASDAE